MESTRISYLQQRFKFFLLRLRKRIWWDLVPGINVKIAWPAGDPNEYYRPWIEEHIGKQYIAWDWDLIEHDYIEDTLTVRLRADKKDHAIPLKLKWL